MSLAPLLLLLLLGAVQASHFYGAVMTWYPEPPDASGAVTVVFRYKLSFHSCSQSDRWACIGGGCRSPAPPTEEVVQREGGGEWCQKEGVETRRFLSTGPLQLQ
ncbi:hypothetical protein EYF80_067458 [Liparis tanakae]|uniref:Fibronectin type-III domain-containing protein n=1 Tax=Liparis tanakae TaxID=230148 RepID=A0A4Z2E143_9TELE|nr:hypothetical protein EYF80_067458 [Liparis tanakae]